MPKLKAVFFDFDGVLSKDRFYESAAAQYPQVIEYVNTVIFQSKENYADKWMRGEISYHDINNMIANATRVPVKTIDILLIESLKNFKINAELLDFALWLKQNKISIAMVTNNMDIFNEVTVPTHNLNKIFPVIVNSSDHGALKHEKEGILYDIALKKIGLDSFENILLIDDSGRACAMFKLKGGKIYQYKEIEKFREWQQSHKELFL